MTRKAVNALLAQADATIEDNTSGNITALDVRTLFKDIADTFKPGYGAVSRDLLTLVALTTTPQIVTYTTQLAATPEYAVNLGAGTITRLAQGLPSTVNRISFYANLAGASGIEFTLGLYRDGILVPGGTTVSGQGAGNVVQAAFSIGLSDENAADHVYSVRATKDSGAADNVDLSNIRFILELVPTIGI